MQKQSVEHLEHGWGIYIDEVSSQPAVTDVPADGKSEVDKNTEQAQAKSTRGPSSQAKGTGKGQDEGGKPLKGQSEADKADALLATKATKIKNMYLKTIQRAKQMLASIEKDAEWQYLNSEVGKQSIVLGIQKLESVTNEFGSAFLVRDLRDLKKESSKHVVQEGLTNFVLLDGPIQDLDAVTQTLLSGHAGRKRNVKARRV